MFNTTSFLFQNTTRRSNRFGEDYRVSAAARTLYELVRERVRLNEFGAFLAHRAPRRLMSLDAATRGRRIQGRRYAGLQSVPLSQIAGSVDRADEFDADLRPLDDSTQQRWLRVATARSEGQDLPPVELIRIGNIYFIQDGHHRASVARARGEHEIEAEVTDWELG